MYVADSRFDRTLRPVKLTWPELCRKLAQPKRDKLTMEQYLALGKDAQLAAKDVGGFVGGALRKGERKKNAVEGRDLLTLDFDSFSQEHLRRLRETLRCQWLVHSTRKHTDQAWRVRIVIRASRTLLPEEYEAVCRRVLADIGPEGCDRTTCEPSRLMFFPSVCSDAPYLFETSPEDALPLDVGAVLSSYANWRDQSQWPTLPGENETTDSGNQDDRTMPGIPGRPQKDPTQKEGIVGDFCRAYDIHLAIATFLPDTYRRHSKNRYTYAGSSSSGGAIVYDNGKFLYVQHATDPCSGLCLNSFDLVRRHRFGHLDKDWNDPTHPNRAPSFKAMEALAEADQRVGEQTAESRRRKALESLEGVDLEAGAEDDSAPPGGMVSDWQDVMAGLESDKYGNLKNTVANAVAVIRHHPALKGILRLNELTGDVEITGKLPWKHVDTTKCWNNYDDSSLRVWLGSTFGISGKERISDAFASVVADTSYHPVRDYLNSLTWDGTPRVRRIFCDSLGAEDIPMNEELAELLLRGAVARAMEPGCKFDYCMILQGPEGCCKSSMLSILGGEWFNDSLTTIEGKEGMEALAGTWISEFSELSAVRNSDVEKLKAFISSTTDRFRPAYGRVRETRPRQCVFVATTNEDLFLRGLNTGNRRHPVVAIRPELRKVGNPYDWFTENRDQVWAEALVIYRNAKREGRPLLLSEETAARVRQAQEQYNVEAQNPLHGEIMAFLDLPLPDDWDTAYADVEKRRQWVADNMGRADSMARSTYLYQPRTRVCVAEVLQEFLGMRKTDREYASKSRMVGRLLSSEGSGWRQEGSQRHPIYGKQKIWVRENVEGGTEAGTEGTQHHFFSVPPQFHPSSTDILDSLI